MSATALFAAALLAQAAPAAITVEAGAGESRQDRVEVAYDELAAGHTSEALARLRANRAQMADEPAALINLGAAHARMGKMNRARKAYRAAIASRDRYDVELADGRWMDSRAAARLAMQRLEKGQVLALK
jgi:uncharacterized protein HemY